MERDIYFWRPTSKVFFDYFTKCIIKKKMFLKKWNFFILCNESYIGSVQNKVLIFDPLPSSGSNSYKKK